MTADTTIYDAFSVPSFCVGNPLAEALPSIPADDALGKALLKPPRGDFSDSRIGSPSAFYEVSTLLDISHPRPESFIFARRIFSMIYNTYSRTDPCSPEFIHSVNYIDDGVIRANERQEFQNDAMAVIAWSGMGKTTLCSSVLSLLPRVIKHTTYKGKPFLQMQIVYLSVDAPVGGSPKGFLLNIARSLDIYLGLFGPASYYDKLEGMSAESMKVHIARALRIHCVGLLHVDDLQRWAEADATLRKTSVAMLVGLCNTIGCSLLLSGTPAAVPVLQSNFESVRRANRRSSLMIQAPSGADDTFFRLLIDYLFKFQLCQPQIAPTEELRKTLMRLTAGIPGVLTSLYVSAQETALMKGMPLSAELFQTVMDSDYAMLNKSVKELSALRAKGGPSSWDADIDKRIGDFLRNRRGDSSAF